MTHVLAILVGAACIASFLALSYGVGSFVAKSSNRLDPAWYDKIFGGVGVMLVLFVMLALCRFVGFVILGA